MPQRVNQRERILRLFQSRAGQWVPLHEITLLAAQYKARIFELRSAGHEIRNRTGHRNGAVHSWFMLVLPKEQGQLFAQQPKPDRGHWVEVLGKRI